MTLIAITLLGCQSAPSTNTRQLVLGAYTTPREVVDQHVLPAFKARWLAEHGEELTFETSYQASGAQARAIAGGFEADVVWLSLDADVQHIADAGLITHDWRATANAGIASTSLVVVGVREGNPKGIDDWDDLAAPGVEVLTPNVRTSGGAMWNVLALVGASQKAGGDAEALLAGVLGNVRVMDKSGRDSVLTFEKGVGDALITYENEVVVARRAGRPVDYVIPPATLRIENPAAVVDTYAERHGVRDIAEAFVAFLAEPAQQKAFVEYGLRPVDGSAAEGLPAARAVFTVAELGGWPAVQEQVFADGALYDRALARSRATP